MLFLLFFQSMAGMAMDEVQTPHHSTISTSELAKTTIAFCKRTGQTQCHNEVSTLSGGTKVDVCKKGNIWVVNNCPRKK